MITIEITQTHPDPNYALPLSNLFTDYGENPNYEKIIELWKNYILKHFYFLASLQDLYICLLVLIKKALIALNGK